MSGFLPITKKEMRERGITQFDFVYVIGDAYVDQTILAVSGIRE